MSDDTVTTTAITPTPTKPLPPSIYFGGASCGISYFLGVAKKMKETWGDDFHTKTLLCGGSIGSVIALQLAIGLSIDDITLHIKNIFKQYIRDPHYWTGQNFWLDKYIDDLLQIDSEIYKNIEGRFQCGTTREYFEHQWHTKWENNAHLARCIKGGYNIPLYCDHCEPVDGHEVIDGAYGFNDSFFPHGNNTLFIGANQSCAEINYDLTIEQMVIPDTDFDFLFRRGMKLFDQWDGVYTDKQGKRQPNHMMLMVCWFGKYVQILYDFICCHIIEPESSSHIHSE